MKILIHSIFYAPTLIGGGKYTGEMAEWFASNGHSVRVVTAAPFYPAWKVERGYSAWRYQREQMAGVKIWRTPAWVSCEPSSIKRLMHSLSFAILALPVMLWQAFWRPDLVIVIEPPLFCAPNAWLTARLASAQAVLHIQDFEIDAAFDLGILRSSLLRRAAYTVEKWIMSRFDQVSTISRHMVVRLNEKGVEQTKQIFFPNWVDISEIYPIKHTSIFRKELKIREECLVALYSGNMGEKQGLEVIIEAARKLKDNHEVVFVLCGDGAAYGRLRTMAEELNNIHWLPLQSSERLNELLNMADIHLLPQRAAVANSVMPSKITGMMASGRPVLAMADSGSEVAQVLKKAGHVVPFEDIGAFVSGLERLAENPEWRSSMGQAGRRFAEEHLDKTVVLSRFEQDVLGCISK